MRMTMLKEPSLALTDQDRVTKKLSAEVKLTLQTKVAQSLFNGSWKHGRMGLLQFAKVMTALWNAASQDDPYAEWFLLKTYQNLISAREQLNAFEEILSPLLKNLRGIEVNQSITLNPIIYPLTFATPFGFMGAYLIADADHIIRLMLTVERLGIPLNRKDMTIKSVTHIIQEVFSTPRGWKRTEVTRQDLKLNNDKACFARSELGEVPESILEKQIEFSFLPKKSKEMTNG
jgi:integrating conjugative element protein (TIGR03761 family)